MQRGFKVRELRQRLATAKGDYRRILEEKIAALESGDAFKSEEIDNLIKSFDETKHRRNPRGSDGGGRFAAKAGAVGQRLKDHGVLTPSQLAVSAAGGGAWAAAENLASRLLPGGAAVSIGRRIAAKWVAPAMAAGVASEGASRALRSKDDDTPYQSAGRAIGSLAGYSLAMPFSAAIPGGFLVAPTLGSVAGEQFGSIVGRQLDRRMGVGRTIDRGYIGNAAESTASSAAEKVARRAMKNVRSM